MIKIIFNNHKDVYFPGQKVTGCVKVNSRKSIDIKGVSIKFTGQANTFWTDSETGTHSGKEEYYTSQVYLFGNGSNIVKLSIGIHEYKFNFTLPENIPSSFESKIGQVRHECKAKIIIPGREDIEVHKLISIKHIYDLNRDENAMSVVYRDSINGFSTELKNNTIAKLSKDYISGRGEHVIWSNTGVLIPAVPASFLQHCNIIDICYKLKVIMSPSLFTRDLDIEEPIIIGSIPLQQQHFNHYQMNSNRNVPGADFSNMDTNYFVERSSRINIPQTTTSSASSQPITAASDDRPPAYNHEWLNDTDAPSAPPVFPGFVPEWLNESGYEQYPEMPPPSYSDSQQSVPMDDS